MSCGLWPSICDFDTFIVNSRGPFVSGKFETFIAIYACRFISIACKDVQPCTSGKVTAGRLNARQISLHIWLLAKRPYALGPWSRID